jgi:hypothetical protein
MRNWVMGYWIVRDRIMDNWMNLISAENSFMIEAASLWA